MKVVSERLGHSSTAIMVDLCTHVVPVVRKPLQIRSLGLRSAEYRLRWYSARVCLSHPKERAMKQLRSS